MQDIELTATSCQANTRNVNFFHHHRNISKVQFGVYQVSCIRVRGTQAFGVRLGHACQRLEISRRRPQSQHVATADGA
jgi:hypothetical protein